MILSFRLLTHSSKIRLIRPDSCFEFPLKNPNPSADTGKDLHLSHHEFLVRGKTHYFAS